MGWDFWSGGDSKADNAAKKAAKIEEARQEEIDEGTARIREMFSTQFDPAYYDKLTSDYMGYYQPQLNKQYEDSSQALQYGLARTGLLDRSSAAGQKFGDLQEQMTIQQQQLLDRANQGANQRRLQNQGALDSTLLQLQSSADASGAAADAANRFEAAQNNLAYEPLGQVFTDATYGLATQADLERAGNSRYQTGLFAPKVPNSGGSGATIT